MDLEDKIELYLRGYEEGQKEAWNEIKGMVSKFEGWKLKSRVESKLGTLYQGIESKRVKLKENPQKLKIEEENEKQQRKKGVKEEKTGGELDFDKDLTYLVVEENPTESLKGLRSMIEEGCQGMIISRKDPDSLAKKNDLKAGDVSLVWLTKNSRKGENIKTVPTGDLSTLSIVIGEFLEDNDSPVIHLTGLPNLINNKDFQTVMKFISWVIDKVCNAEGSIILSVPDKALKPKNFIILKDEFHEVVN